MIEAIGEIANMGTVKPDKRVFTRVLKTLLITVFSVIAILLVFFSGLLLGQRESLHDSGHSVISIALEENEPDISDNSMLVKLDDTKLEAVATISPIEAVNYELQKYPVN